jgi:hypothetical protein
LKYNLFPLAVIHNPLESFDICQSTDFIIENPLAVGLLL